VVHYFLMKDFPIRPLELPPSLAEIPDPPKQLFIRGNWKWSPHERYLTVIGSRNYTRYAADVIQKFLSDLAGYPIVIVSGLALGIDALAHQQALNNNLTTIAFPGSGLDERVLYPARHLQLAQQILSASGALISELNNDEKAARWTFPRRNRLMAGISDAVLVVEAANKSGSRITTKLATEYNREVLTVPGSVFSPVSEGTNQLLREGATPVTCAADILEALHLTQVERPADTNRYADCTDQEQKVLAVLSAPKARNELIRELGWPTPKANVVLSTLEIKGLITESMGELRRV
jgi:DNA processing protein